MPSTVTSATGGYLLPTNAPPATDFDLDRRLNMLISGITGISGSLIRPRWQPVPPQRPDENTNWIAFGKIRSDAEVGSPFILHDSDANDGDGLDRLLKVVNLMYMVTFYGPQCEQYASLFTDGLSIRQNHEAILFHGLDLKEIGDQIFVPEQINTRWYRRVDVSLKFLHMYAREYSVLNILEAQGQLHTQQPPIDGNVVDVNWDTNLVNEQG